VLTKLVDRIEPRQADVPYVVNAQRNAGRIARAASVDSFFGRKTGAPIVVACAGASLARNLDDLRPWRERVVLVADAAAAPLVLSSGLVPDFVVALDPATVDVDDLAGLAASGVTSLVAEGAMASTVVHDFNHRVFVFRNTDQAPWPWLKRMGFERPLLHGTGSTMTCAFELALRMGADPVVMIGADVADARRDLEWIASQSTRPKMPRLVNATGVGRLGGGGIRLEPLSGLGLREWLDADLARPNRRVPRRSPDHRPKTGDRFDFHLLDVLMSPNDWLVFDGSVEDLACRAVSRFVPPRSRVLDLSVGHHRLEHCLPLGCVHTRGEVVGSADDTHAFRMPEGKFDVIAALGVLQRVADLPALLASIATRAPLLVTSLCVNDARSSRMPLPFAPAKDRSLETFVWMVQKTGWDLRVAERLDTDAAGETWVFALARR
jgi:hypothetical protein